MKRFVDNLSVSRGTQRAMLLGAVLGTAFAVTGAGALVVYAVGIGVCTVFCLLEELAERGAFRRDQGR